MGPSGAPGVYSGRNAIINGDFSVNQRAFTSATVNGYGLDRWRMTKLGGVVTYSVQQFALGALENSPKQYARIHTTGQSATTDYTHFSQLIENVKLFSGSYATVSLWAKASGGNPKIWIEARRWFGGGGSPTENILIGSQTLSTTWTRYSFAVYIPSVSGKTIAVADTDTILELCISTSAGSSFSSRLIDPQIQNDVSIDIWGVQMESGIQASEFEHIPYGQQLQNCQRYYQQISGSAGRPIGFGRAQSATGAYIGIPLPVAMRADPTATITACVLAGNGAAVNYSGTGVCTRTENGIFLNATGVTGLTTNHAYALWVNTSVAQTFSAEL
jgi:hypothetical protein